MSQVVTVENVLVIAANFQFYFIIGICGAFTKDLYDNFVNGKKKIEIIRVFIAAISTAFIAIGLQDYLSAHFSLNIIILFSFLCGVVGFEIFRSINSIKNLKVTILEIIQIKKLMDAGGIDELEKTIKAQKAELKEDEKIEENIQTTQVEHETESVTKKDTSHDETNKDSLLMEVINENSQ